MADARVATRFQGQPPGGPAQRRAGKNPADAWMDQGFKFAGSVIKRKTVALILLGIPALVPIFFMSRAILDANQNTLSSVEPDVLGTGSMALLILTLTVTPMVTLTGQRWFVPLRKWYGIMLAINATTDGILAAIVGQFAGGIVGRIAGHTFLLAGLTMVVILVPLALISNTRAQRWLGKYWKTLQKLTYVIWGLLFVHLILLEGFFPQHGTNGPSASDDGEPVLHQRVYQLAACSLPLLLLRLPPVRRWVELKHKQGQQWLVNLTVLPLAALYVLFFSFIVNEEIFKGVSAFRLQPVNG